MIFEASGFGRAAFDFILAYVNKRVGMQGTLMSCIAKPVCQW